MQDEIIIMIDRTVKVVTVSVVTKKDSVSAISLENELEEEKEKDNFKTENTRKYKQQTHLCHIN